jgi:hypothetical protein
MNRRDQKRTSPDGGLGSIAEPSMRRRYWVLTILAGPVLWFANYWHASHSEGFRYVRSKVLASSEVASKVGKIEGVHMPLLGRYSAHYGETYTLVHMRIEALGNNGKCDLEVDAEKNDEGVWQIKRATVQGRLVRLE